MSVPMTISHRAASDRREHRDKTITATASGYATVPVRAIVTAIAMASVTENVTAPVWAIVTAIVTENASVPVWAIATAIVTENATDPGQGLPVGAGVVSEAAAPEAITGH